MQYSYQATNKEGAKLSGHVDAPSESAAVGALHERGLTIISLEPVTRSIFSGGDLLQFLNRPKTKDVAAFMRQLSVLIEADLPLTESIRTLATQTPSIGFRRIIGDVADRLEGGSSLSEAFATHPKQFSSLSVKLIHSGEVSGRLKETLSYLADYLERNQKITSKVTGALAYPVFVIFTMIVVAIIMVVYVLPQLLVIFKESGITELPLSTKILIWITDTVNNYFAALFIVSAIAIAGIFQWMRMPNGQAWWQRTQLRIPGFGKIIRAFMIARLAENLSTLVKSDIAILDALRVTGDIMGNVVYRDILLHAEEEVRGGGTMSDVLRRYPEDIPALVTSMIAVGERSSKVGQILERVGTFYRTESEGRIDTISSLIEPVLVTVLGLGVAVLVSSVLLPIYSLVGAS